MISPVFILIGLTVLISAYAWSNDGLMQAWILRPYIMARDRGQWYRFVTSGFLHADWGHLFFNLLTFYFFADNAFYQFAARFGPLGGTAAFLLLYIGGIVVSDIPTYLRHRDDRLYGSLGASGGVASVMFAGILFQPTAKIYMMLLPIGIPGFIWGMLYLLYSQYMSRQSHDNINHDAHFYGALWGLVITVLLVPSALGIFAAGIRSFLF